MPLFWYFFVYSLMGYGLEKTYAYATHASKQNRKGCILLPLCPVYGVAMALLLSLPHSLTDAPAEQFLWGALIATASEYAVHLFYDSFFAVRFWDYSGVFGNLQGRVCLPFSLIWGVLTTVALTVLQPAMDAVIAVIPSWVTLSALMVTSADLFCALRLLSLYHDTELLSVHRLRSADLSP